MIKLAEWLIMPSVDEKVLSDADVPYIPVTISKPKKGEYPSFPKEYLTVVLVALKHDPEIVQWKEEITDVKEVGYITLDGAKATKRKQLVEKRVESSKSNEDRDAYLRACLARYKGQIQTLRDSALDSEKTVEKIQRQLIEAMRQKEEIETRIAEINARGIDRLTKEEIGREFDKICSFPAVESVNVKDGWLKVETRDIHHQDVGKLGRFEIQIQLTSDSKADHYGISTIKISSLNQFRKHPHAGYAPRARYGDDYCLGESIPMIVEALRRYEFAIVLDLIIRFLEEA